MTDFFVVASSQDKVRTDFRCLLSFKTAQEAADAIGDRQGLCIFKVVAIEVPVLVKREVFVGGACG